MKTWTGHLWGWLSLAAVISFNISITAATTHYVDANGTNPVSPYTDWSTAATNIQDAIDASTTGDLVLVTNGVYATGGRRLSSVDVTNRVTITNVVVVESINGPTVTIIQGYQVPVPSIPTNAVRCAFVGSGSLLSGFTLTNGEAGLGNNVNGGGAEGSPSGVVSNCVLIGNICGGAGGGADHVTLVNCVLTRNHAEGGGAASWSAMVNCTITNNIASWAGGILSSKATNCVIAENSATNYGGGSGFSTLVNCTVADNSLAPGYGGNGGGSYNDTLSNCIVYDNSAPNGSNYYSSVMTFCCSAPLPGGSGNISNPPLFVNSTIGDFHLNPASPCVNSGNNAFVTISNDLDGNPRIVGGIVDMGAYEFPDPIHYVNIGNPAPASPFTNWPAAATNIQDAIDASSDGDLILVTNGVYATGGETVNGYSLTNRVVINKAVTVQSVNGPDVTMIRGNQPIGNNAVRCVYLTNNAVLAGFTLTNGATRNSGNYPNEQSGGGVWCEGTNAFIFNCDIYTNVANYLGGGAYYGSFSNCVLLSNSALANGGGAYSSILNNCVVSNNHFSGAIHCILLNSMLVNNIGVDGGGAGFSTLVNCKLISNSADYGGGADSSVLTNCLLFKNSASEAGGGAGDGSILVSCTVVSNTAGHAAEGGISGTCQPRNCIVYFNNYNTGNFPTYVSATNCCVTPLPTTGFGNITNEPDFVNLAAGDFHLQSNSPCINSGNNIYVASTTDLDGNPRISGGTVDIGAYEYQSPSSILSYAWAQQYGLPTDGTADYADSDGTGMNNWQKWIAGLDPTNPASVLAMQVPAATNNAGGITVTWLSVNTRTYYLQRATDLTAQPPFSAIQSNLVGQAGTTSYTDASATNAGPYFYRVGVQ